MWGQLFLFLSSVVCIYLVFAKISDRYKDLKISLIVALSLWLLSQIIYSGEFNFNEQLYHNIVHIIIISVILSSELILVRLFRPSIFRYPYLLVYTPLLIPFSFIMIIDTYLIKDIIFMATQGIAMVVYLFLMMDDHEVKLGHKSAIVGLILIFVAYLLYWFVQNMIPVNQSIWEVLLAVGVVVLVHSFTSSLQHEVN